MYPPPIFLDWFPFQAQFIDHMQRKKRPPQLPPISPFDLLWRYQRREPTAFNIFRAARAAHVWKHSDLGLKARVVLRYLQWFWMFPINILTCQIRYGKITSRSLHRSRAGQVYDLIRLALRNNLLPVDYYKGGLARYHGTSALFNYIPEQLYETILAFLRENGAERGPSDLKKKLRFEEQCREYQLPCVRTVAVAEPDGSFPGFAGDLPARSLFLKPARGTQGKGTERWQYEGAEYVRLGREERLSAQGLRRRASELARERKIPTLIQEALTNHPDIRKLAGETIATSRIITLIDEAGSPEVVFAALRVASKPDCPADNFHSGGILFPVNVDTGKMSGGLRLDYCERPQSWTVNPLTGARVEGIVQPCYRDAWNLALKSHAVMSDRILMGWDIATTPEGPVIVEGGGKPGMPMVCQIGLEGFLHSRLSVLLASHVLHRLAQSEPTNSRWRFAGSDPDRQTGRSCRNASPSAAR